MWQDDGNGVTVRLKLPDQAQDVGRGLGGWWAIVIGYLSMLAGRWMVTAYWNRSVGVGEIGVEL